MICPPFEVHTGKHQGAPLNVVEVLKTENFTQWKFLIKSIHDSDAPLKMEPVPVGTR